MRLSPDDIKTLWERYGGLWGKRGAEIITSTENLTAFCDELAAIARDEKTLHEIDPHDVKVLYQRLVDLDDGGGSHRAIDDAAEAVREALRVRLDRPEGDFEFGPHRCAGSPTGECVYDLNDDELAGEDECMFCHDPNERK